jgi:hypothetical protein
MAFHQQQTSLISILSTDHGRMRREERDINKRDLQKALKFGTRERSWGSRWKIEYDGIIFIADNSLRQEVTCYPSPLAFADIDEDAHTAHSKAKSVIDQKPELCVSHSVLIVDNSGSMCEHDIPLHRDRQVAAYTTMALEFVAEQLFNGTANNSDVVSLVEFSNNARVILKREPITWVLYNKLLSRRDGRGFTSRESAKLKEIWGCDSNYLPALDAANMLLATGLHDACALSVFFLSDGAPSDARQLELTPAAAQRQMCKKIGDVASRYGGQLNITLVGFGNKLDDFSVLEAMAKAVKDAPGDAKADFVYCSKMPNAIGTALSSLVTSLTATRNSLMHGRSSRYTKRIIDSEEGIHNSADWRFHFIRNHFIYNPITGSFIQYPGLPPGALNNGNRSEAERRRKLPPPFLAISTKICGEGAERVAFRCQLADKKSPDSFAFSAMVAKETNSVERIEENEAFHTTFCETQGLAAYLAQDFNHRLRALPGYDEKTTPQITFLQCSVLILEDSKWPGGVRGLLVEKMLDTARHGWCKWNDNAGAIDGRAAHVPIDVDYEFAKLRGKMEDLCAIAEGDSDEESEDSDDEAAHDDVQYENDDNAMRRTTTSASDYLQAFTHFTYRVTNKKVMVCDLQGVYDADAVPPKFELTDPAIHYASKRGREMVFGRTDKGKKGVQLFFDSHKCTSVCKLMQLSKQNPDWRKAWHSEFELHNSK